jgi:H+/Cl- antiporter ClcA
MQSDPDQHWFSHQPNVTGHGIIASYSWRFWALVLTLGVVAGISASALIALLTLVERLSYGNLSEGYLAAVRAAPGWRHVVVLLLAALIVIVGLRLLGHMASTGGTEVSESLWLRRGRVAFWPSIARGVLSIVIVGMGVSLGREAAPQIAGAATASKLADWAELPIWQRRLLVASGAGAGFAAVYNVPLGGTLLAVEVLLGTLALPLVIPALLTSATATAVAWITLGTGPTYHVAAYNVHLSQLVWAAVVGPPIGLLAYVWTQLISRAGQMRPRGIGRYMAPPGVFLALALLSIPYPELLGNGKDIVQLAIAGGLSIGLLAVLFVLKPLVTAACVWSGAPGGLFTPTFAVGVLFAGVAGTAWVHVWPGAPEGSFALIGGGAFLAASMQGPLSGAVLVLELTRHFDALMVPTLIAVVGATVVARRLGAHSIYSARLPSDPALELRPTASAAATATLHALDETLAPDMAQPPPTSGHP